jgi:hypothetical protein
MITESLDTDIIALGRAGHARGEIAAAMGMTLAQVAEREAGDAGFAEAMALAEEAARAWWAGLQREAMTAGARFGLGAWREAVRWRFGAAGGGAARGATAGGAAAGADAAEEPFDILAEFDLPDDGLGPRADGLSRRDDPDACKAADLAAAQKDIVRLTRQIADLNEELHDARIHKENIESDDYRDDYDDDDD